MVIEFFGLPGAGKTYYCELISKQMKLKSKNKIFISRNFNDKYLWLKFLLSRSIRLKKYFRLYDGITYNAIQANESILNELRPFYRNYSNIFCGQVNDINQFPLIMRSLERDLFLSCWLNDSNHTAINDDGVMQRLFSIFGIRDSDWQTPNSQKFILSTLKIISSKSKFVYFESDLQSFRKKINSRTNLDLKLEVKNIYDLWKKGSEFNFMLYSTLLDLNCEVIKVNSGELVEQNIAKIKEFIKSE